MPCRWEFSLQRTIEHGQFPLCELEDQLTIRAGDASRTLGPARLDAASDASGVAHDFRCQAKAPAALTMNSHDAGAPAQAHAHSPPIAAYFLETRSPFLCCFTSPTQ